MVWRWRTLTVSSRPYQAQLRSNCKLVTTHQHSTLSQPCLRNTLTNGSIITSRRSSSSQGTQVLLFIEIQGVQDTRLHNRAEYTLFPTLRISPTLTTSGCCVVGLINIVCNVSGIKRNRYPLRRKTEKQERSRSEHKPSQSWRPREENCHKITKYREK